jgi:type IV pilus assembly protein PilB
MVGEVRDAETAEMMTHAALTGHLVLSTLHTNNAAGAIPRLINMGVEPFLITSSMNAIVGQRLVRRVCSDCRQPVHVPQEIVDEITQELKDAAIPDQYKDPANWHFYHGKGCSKCHNGYRGRVGLFEVLVMSQAIEDLAIKKEPESVIEQQAIKEGMLTLKQDGLLKAIRGLTTIEEVMKASAE